MDNFSQCIQFGSSRPSQTIDTVFQVMRSMYIPSTMDTASWPAPVKKEFTRAVHKFMASLSEAVHNSSGKTILYIPQEKITDPEQAAKDKDLVQLLESTVIHWTRQIKEVITNHDSVSNAETAGPLDEIEFWRFRTVDLSGISEQLSTPEVQRILAVLSASKSSYLEPFMRESQQIEIGCAEANDNLKFLKVCLVTHIACLPTALGVCECCCCRRFRCFLMQLITRSPMHLSAPCTGRCCTIRAWNWLVPPRRMCR